MVIESINPVIRGWGNYFKGGTVKILIFGIPPSEFAKMGLVSLSYSTKR